ncbi:uncharacterized protein MYCFIDRAFT_45021 [Pseudocercospora fijiensis CIRAD86]|uniref:C-CAP/cofactor C-like domain-containing protein n=1 Tax=Pseudocercospora fijiensis (strain CIRAD86) TaxID=383855 RepID=M3AKD6_PSEFD|nr:uncharacterized protein MYCFIDRAFT_45021 [Pseudocercospora fijiensis CIRAD86]EME77628.1 hypothetical protein MYCFIDRAFT_45021 [Pseudocercospora fijiensis CIRAD86]
MATAATATSDEQAAPAAQLNPSQKFFRYFQHEVTDLQEQMARIGQHSITGGERADAIEHCLSGIARLSSEVQDASSYIPAYDQRTYGEAIKALNSKLQEVRASYAPKPKFSFKSKSGPLFSAGKNESAISLSDAAELADQKRRQITGYVSDVSNASSLPTTPAEFAAPADEQAGSLTEANRSKSVNLPVDTTRFRQPSFSDSNAVSINNHENVHIVLPTSASHATSSGTVSDLERCVVDLSQPAADKPFAQLILKNITSSLIIGGHVSGAAHITNVKDSVILVTSRQFRMHDSSNCDVYLLTSSRPIIENCSSIRFTPLPKAYMLESDKDIDNQWHKVDDFNWLRTEQSPNWSTLEPGKMVDEKIWRDIVPGGPSTSVDDILKAVNVTLT